MVKFKNLLKIGNLKFQQEFHGPWRSAWEPTCPLAKVPEVAHILHFYFSGQNLTFFTLYEQQFPRYMPIFKIAIFGHETWSLAKVPEVAHILSLCSRGSKLSLFSLYRQWFPRHRKIFQIAILGIKFGHWPKCQKLHIYPLSTPTGRNWAYFWSMGSSFRDTGRFSKLPY